jgi:hypothetical protein
MKYQLVLQWPVSSLDSYDSLVEIEEILIEELASDAEVDGHDIGANEMNIFILTDDPKRSFVESKRIIDKTNATSEVRAAYREVTGDRYTILWPPHLNEFTVT